MLIIYILAALGVLLLIAFGNKVLQFMDLKASVREAAQTMNVTVEEIDATTNLAIHARATYGRPVSVAACLGMCMALRKLDPEIVSRIATGSIASADGWAIVCRWMSNFNDQVDGKVPDEGEGAQAVRQIEQYMKKMRDQ